MDRQTASLGLFLAFQLSGILGKGETEVAELAGQMIGKSDRTIREWKSKFLRMEERYQIVSKGIIRGVVCCGKMSHYM